MAGEYVPARAAICLRRGSLRPSFGTTSMTTTTRRLELEGVGYGLRCERCGDERWEHVEGLPAGFDLAC